MHALFFSLTGANFLLLVLLLAGHLPARASGEAAMLRGSGLEIVDAMGRVRASIGILPAGATADGQSHPATVLLRLIDEAGQPSIKIGADGTLAGISLVGGDDQSYVILQSDGPESLLKLVEGGGKEVAIGPS